MGFFDFFSKKTFEDHEHKADSYFDANAFGQAKIEYEKALSKLEKETTTQPMHKERLEKKIVQSKEALALQHKQTGKDLMETGHYEDAEEILRLALELTETAELSDEIGGLLENILDYHPDTPLNEFEAEEKPESQENPHDHTQEKEYFTALCSTLPEIEQQVYPEYGDAFRKGYVALNQGDFNSAVNWLSQALEAESSPESFIPLELATAYLNLGNSKEAYALLEGFIKSHPESIKAYSLMCDILWEQDAFDQAQQLLRSCPQALRDSAAINLLQGETLFQAGKYQEAESVYLDALKRDGGDENMIRSLAKTYEKLGLIEKARDLYGELLAACAGCGRRADPFIVQRYADTSLETGQFSTKILELYFILVKEDPNNQDVYYQKISRIYDKLGNEKEARRFRSFSKNSG